MSATGAGSAKDNSLKTFVAEVAAAYFANSHVAPSDIPSIIGQIAGSLGAIGAPATASPAPGEQVAAAKATRAQIRKSITPEGLYSFEDGKPYKTLKRHLATRGLTPDQYRE